MKLMPAFLALNFKIKQDRRYRKRESDYRESHKELKGSVEVGGVSSSAVIYWMN